MPSTSDRQRNFMRMVYAYKKGKLKDASPQVIKAAETISTKAAKEFAEMPIHETFTLKDFLAIDTEKTNGTAT